MVRRALVFVILVLLPTRAWSAEDLFFDSAGVRIHYTVQGKGTPVLLIHGFTANIPLQWGIPGIIHDLAKHYRVIAMDTRGHGRSDKPHEPDKYGIAMVEDAVRLLDHLHIKKAHVVGYSMGAMIAAKLIAVHPDRVLSATLGGAAGLHAGAYNQFFTQLADSLEKGQGLRALLDALTPPGQPKPTDEQIRFLNQLLAATNDTKALAACVRGWDALAVPDEQLRTNRVPTLCLIGEDDPLKRRVDEIRDRMANLQVVVIQAADHMNAFRQPEFLRALEDFLARHDPRKARPAASPARESTPAGEKQPQGLVGSACRAGPV
jgi:pimeloyl-ACP methyl ester carboxylesterase